MKKPSPIAEAKMLPLPFSTSEDQDICLLQEQLAYLKMPTMAEQFEPTAQKASAEKWGYIRYLSLLIEQECELKRQRAMERSVIQAHFPVIKTLDQFQWRWPEIFNNDSTLTSALLDRILHHAQTVIIEGKSYRMKDQDKK